MVQDLIFVERTRRAVWNRIVSADEYPCLGGYILGTFKKFRPMMKRLTLTAACALTMITPLSAQNEQADVAKLRVDHERLIDLVLTLEADFGETLRDYANLQKDFAKVLKRPTVPDQSGKVKELQKQLKAATAGLEESGQSKMNELVLGDLKALRNELHRERAALLVAKAQLSQLQKLKTRTAELEKLLEGEEARSAESMAKLQVVRGERDALMARLNDMLAKAGVAEKALMAANQKIQVLEKEAEDLKVQIARRDTEIEKLKADPAPDKALMAAMDHLKKEGARLAKDLEMRETELATLRTALATEKERALDVPMLLKARVDLKNELAVSSAALENTKAKLVETEKTALAAEATADSLKEENAKLAKVENDLKMITGQLTASQEKVKAAEAVSAERDDLTEKLSQAALQMKKSAAAAADQLQADYGALDARAADLEKQKSALEVDLAKRDGELKAMRAEMSRRPDLSKKVAQLEAEKEEVVLKHKVMLAAQLDLKRSLDEASMQLRKANESAAAAGNLRADYDALASRAADLEEEKAALVANLAKGDETLKALRAEMSKTPDLSDKVLKLEEEKKRLEAQLATREADLTKARRDLGKLHLNSAAMEKQLVSLKRSTAQIDSVRYAKGEADVNDQQERVLGQVQGVLKAFPSARFEIVGHTCDLGSKEGNLRLSHERAKTLQNFLAQKGVPVERLKSRGVADAEPVVPNTNEGNRRKNRRVEIEILD